MNAQDIPRNGDDYAGAALLDAAAALLAKRRSDIPDDFVAKLFGLAVPEDLERYGAAGASRDRRAIVGVSRRTDRRRAQNTLRAGRRVAGLCVLEILNDDMPFLVDSVVGELNRRGLDIRLFVHPVFVVERDSAGRLDRSSRPRAPPSAGRAKASSIFMSRARTMRRSALKSSAALERVLADVRVCVHDWRPMLARIRGVIAELRETPPPLPVDEIAEAIQFLEWIADDNFTFLGARDFAFTAAGDVLEPDFETGLGLLRSREAGSLQRWNEPLAMTPEIRAFLEEPKLLIVTKSTVRSPVHRRVPLDYIGVKRFDRSGRLVGEHRFCGLFTSTAYTRSARTIPYLRRKTDSIIRRAGFDPSSHSGKALVNVLETYPRDELFQIDEDTLYHFALACCSSTNGRACACCRGDDRFDRFVSVLVYIPRDRYGGQIRAAIGNYLAAAFNGRLSAYYPFFPEGPLVRVHYIVVRSERRDGQSGPRARSTAGRRHRAQLDRWAARGARGGSRSGAWARAVCALSRRVPCLFTTWRHKREHVLAIESAKRPNAHPAHREGPGDAAGRLPVRPQGCSAPGRAVYRSGRCVPAPAGGRHVAMRCTARVPGRRCGPWGLSIHAILAWAV